MNQKSVPAPGKDRTSSGADRFIRVLLFFVIAATILAVPGTAGELTNDPALQNTSAPAVVHVGVFVLDFNKFSVEDGTVETNFYLSLRSDIPVSLDNLEIINGKLSSVDTLIDTPTEKYYRIYAVVTADPSLRDFPFDSHTLPIVIEPKVSDKTAVVMAINTNQSGIDDGVDMPGWKFSGNGFAVTDYTYARDETPYSRAVFSFIISRDSASTLLKFFLPITLIIIVSLSSLLMKVSSRLGLNASMFLAAVLIHWRIADAIPLVGYATYLDYFMMVTYATLVMVLISGILITRFTERKDVARADAIYHGSIRIIPVISIGLYSLLIISLIL